MSEKVRKAIQRAVDNARRKARKDAEFHRTYEKEKERIASIILELQQNGSIKPATAEDYAKWLEAHLENNGDITRIEDRNMPPCLFYIAQKSFDLPSGPEELWSGYYENDLLLIVPAELEVRNQSGYCHTYTMGCRQSYAPLFRNVRRILLSQ